jgi:hypothetical protein
MYAEQNNIILSNLKKFPLEIWQWAPKCEMLRFKVCEANVGRYKCIE